MANSDAIDFEKSSTQFGYVNSTSTPAFASSSYTIEAWVKPESFTNGQAMFVVAKCDGGTANKQFGFGPGANDGAHPKSVYHEHYDSAGNIINLSTDGNELSAGTWAHIAVVNDAGTFTFYVNGVAKTANTLSGTYGAQGDKGTQLRVGERLVGGVDSESMDGMVDDVRFWNYARSATQISANYNKELIGNDVGLIAYWRFNEGTGTTAYDITGSGYDLLLQNTPAWVGSGAFTDTQTFTNTHSLALESGSSQYASVADTTPLSITGNLTLMAWIRPESDTSAFQSIVGKWKQTGNLRSYIMGIGTSGALQLVTSSNGTAETVASSNYVFFLGSTPDTWYHVAVTYNAAGGTCKFYINGVLDSTGSGLSTAINDNASSFAIGVQDVGGTPQAFFDGVIRAVRVFNSELSAAQVLQEMQLTSSGNSPVGAWELNNALTDSSGNSATLTSSGSPVFVPAVSFANHGTVVSLQASAHDYMDSTNPTSNNGNSATIYVGESNAGADVNRTLIKFDLSSIPNSAVINSCFFQLSFATDLATNARVFNIYRVKRAWTELGATYNKYDGTNNWGTAGASNATDREQDIINAYHAQVAAPDTSTPGFKSVFLDPKRIQELIDGTMTNNGFLLQVNVETNDLVGYGGRANGTAALRPVLLIDYTGPATAVSNRSYGFFM